MSAPAPGAGMDLPGPGRVAVALLLASAAVTAAYLYGEGLHGAERHAYAGTWGNRASGSLQDNATLLVYPYDGPAPGDVVRIEEDTAPRYPYPLDLYVVPLGQGHEVPNGTARILLHVPHTPATDRVVGPDLDAHADANATFRIYPNDSDVVRVLNRQFTVPAGVHGVDLVWLNLTQAPPAGFGGITVVITRADGLWLALEPWFLAFEATVVGAALVALVPWRRGRATDPATPPPLPPGPPGLPDVAALFAAAGRHLRQLRDTLLAAGLILLVALALGRQLLGRLLDDTAGVWAPATQDAVQTSYAAAGVAALAAWAILAWRVQRQLTAWRRHDAQNPLA